MNILSNDQMKQAEKILINSYDNLQHKLKFNVFQNFQQTGSSQYGIFKKADSNMKSSISKMVPLTKNLKAISLIQQQNSLFKVITYSFLLIIYKNESKTNQFLKDQIKCSLYSEDINLLDIRNHSFNKKMKSQTIKALIAQFFKQLQYTICSSYYKSKNLPFDQVLQILLNKNDLVLQGFHLFFRTILWKLQVQNAENCIQEVNPEQAISNLVEYFDINCRIFNNLYLFNDDSIFISERPDGNLIFGDYYENEAQFEDSEQKQIQKTVNYQLKNINLNLGKISFKDNQIQKEDIKIFNFMMDTDRQSEIQQANLIEKNGQSETPHFATEQEFAFGKKSDRGKVSLDHSKMNSNRFYNEHINQIQSEEQGFNIEDSNQPPTPFLNSVNNDNSFVFKEQKQNSSNLSGNNMHINQQKKFSEEKTFNFYIQNSEYYEQNDNLPTPVLGGLSDNFFKFPVRKQSFQQKDKISQYQNRGSSKNALNRTIHQIQQESQKEQENSRKIDRRHSIQYSKIENKIQMKTSKNQIKLIDQTASRTILLQQKNQEFEDFQDRNLQNRQNRRANTQNFFGAQIKGLGPYDNLSIPSSCTCCLQKKHKMKMQSKLFQIEICPNKNKHSNFKYIEPNFYKKATINSTNQQNKVKIESSVKNQKCLSQNNIIKKNQKHLNESLKANKEKDIIYIPSQEKNLILQQNIFKPTQPKIRTPQQNNKKREEFLQFLKTDKKHLIKKISDKRQAKICEAQQNLSQIVNKKKFQLEKSKYPHKISQKRIIKQSMFVQPNYLTQYNNPESRYKIQSSFAFQNRINNKSVTPTKYVVGHSKSPLGKPAIIKNNNQNTSKQIKNSFDNKMPFTLKSKNSFDLNIKSAQMDRNHMQNCSNNKNAVFRKGQKQKIRIESQPATYSFASNLKIKTMPTTQEIGAKPENNTYFSPVNNFQNKQINFGVNKSLNSNQNDKTCSNNFTFYQPSQKNGFQFENLNIKNFTNASKINHNSKNVTEYYKIPENYSSTPSSPTVNLSQSNQINSKKNITNIYLNSSSNPYKNIPFKNVK